MYSVFRAILIYHGKLEKRADLSQLWNFKHCKERNLIIDWDCNQIRVEGFNAPQLTQASFLQKNNIAKCFFDICNAEMAQSLSSLQKSEFLKLIILIFHVKKLNN